MAWYERSRETHRPQTDFLVAKRNLVSAWLSRVTDISTLRLVAILAVFCFVIEALIMAFLPHLEIQNRVLEGILAAAFLTVIIIPILYAFVFKNVVRQNDKLRTVERSMKRVQSNLEMKVEKRTEEINKVNQKLEESLSRFADISEVAGDWIWEMDKDLRMAFLSDRFFEIFPIERDQVIGLTRLEFAGTTELDEHWRKHYDDLENHRPFRNFQYDTTQGDGRPLKIQISGKPIFDADGVFKGYRGTGTDRTSENQALEAQEESEKQFRNLIEGSIQGVLIHKDWNILFANQAMADILGFKNPKEVMALKDVFSMISPEERDRLWSYKDAREKGEYVPEIYEAKCIRKDGALIWLEFRARLIEWGGQTVIQSAAIDITERKKGEEELRQQNERFNAALSNMSQGICMFDSEQRIVVSNERYATMYGLSLEQVKPGILYRQVLDARIANNNYAGDNPQKYIKEASEAVTNPEASKKTLEFRNGQFIEIVYQPTADGGWLDTHEDVTEYHRIQQRIAYLAYHDALTGLPNRVKLVEQMEQELKRPRRGDTFALLCLDLDDFKNINDTLGHAAGDDLLKVVGERLKSCVRETDMVARLGGDEFAVIQISKNPTKDAALLAERICNVIRVPIQLDQNEVVVEMSVGIAVAPEHGDDYEALLKNADMALYQAKHNGRGAYCFFKPEMEASVKDHHALALDLRKALGADQFELYYQPLINLKDNKIDGFEALLRWHHPERGMVSPADFIPIAEDMGLINEIGKWVLQQACSMAVNLPDDIKIAVNVSPVQIKRGNLLEVVKDGLVTSGLPASRLEIEITESVMIADKDATIDVLRQLHGLGVHISMDDFGTGYSSLSYLQSFPFDKIKIDSSFVKNLTEGNDGIGIVQAVVGFASRLGVVTIAEGVETLEQLNIIRKEGCTQAQGYFFARPMPASEISLMFLRQLTQKIKNVA